MQQSLEIQIIELRKRIENATNIVLCVGPDLFLENQNQYFYYDGQVFLPQELCTLTGALQYPEAYQEYLKREATYAPPEATLAHELIAFVADYYNGTIITTATDGILENLYKHTICLYGTSTGLVCPLCQEPMSPTDTKCPSCNEDILPRHSVIRHYDLVPQERIDIASNILAEADLVIVMGDSFQNTLFPSLITKNKISSDKLVILYPVSTKFDDLSDLVIQSDITTILTSAYTDEARRHQGQKPDADALKSYLKEVFFAGAYLGKDGSLEENFEDWYNIYTGRA